MDLFALPNGNVFTQGRASANLLVWEKGGVRAESLLSPDLET